MQLSWWIIVLYVFLFVDKHLEDTFEIVEQFGILNIKCNKNKIQIMIFFKQLKAFNLNIDSKETYLTKKANKYTYIKMTSNIMTRCTQYPKKREKKELLCELLYENMSSNPIHSLLFSIQNCADRSTMFSTTTHFFFWERERGRNTTV